MDFTADITKVKELLDKARNVLIVTHENPTDDSMGSALALYLGLTSLGKKVAVACPDPMTVSLSNYVGANKVVSELSKKNFVISLDYVEGSIEKVSYNIEGATFNLVIEPRPGFEPFDQNKVHFSHASTAADCIFSVDTIHLGGLKKLYEDDKSLFAGKPVINIDRHPNNAVYGQVNIVNPQASTTAEVVAQLLSGIGAQLTVDIATNILNALHGATNMFQGTNVTARVFELAAVCVKAGGKRFGTTKSATSEEVSMGEHVGSDILKTEVAPRIAAVSQTESIVTPRVAPQTAPADWLKPKIFKSSTLL
ncbi:DHH family phosphoesterase [Candidatus Gottesmanbacteria bacterium]|nr:DHH family phosphoesterase [Candidatus Gottesmanbacteria bacterium]